MCDFFVSYNHKDRTWAEWIAWTLEEAGYKTTVQDWDFRPGGNFVLQMQEAATNCRRTLAVLSADYLASVFTQPEWAAAFALDPTGREGKLLPVRVAPCEPPGLLRTTVYCDLVGLDPDGARDRLLRAVQPSQRPTTPPRFPGVSPDPGPEQGSAGTTREAAKVQAMRHLLDLLHTTGTTYFAQARLRNELAESIKKRLGEQEELEYERLFSRHYRSMNDEERQIHGVIRAFTMNILSDYNRQVLDVINRHPELKAEVPSLSKLEQHLLVWLAKFTGMFATTPAMCLVYVGVEERVPFPPGIESELQKLVDRSGS